MWRFCFIGGGGQFHDAVCCKWESNAVLSSGGVGLDGFMAVLLIHLNLFKQCLAGWLVWRRDLANELSTASCVYSLVAVVEIGIKLKRIQNSPEILRRLV